MALSELQLNHAAFDMWLMGEGEDNRADLQKLKRILPIVLSECCTEKQCEYISHYFVDRMTMAEIAEKYDVNKATVSRTIRRGLDTAYGYLRFVSPLFIKQPKQRRYLTRNGGAK